jgi:uroporphyrinogen-III synthase
VRIIVTRPRDQAAPLVDRLRELGHEVEVCPLIEIEPTGPEEIDVDEFDWVIVTSANAARELAARMHGRAKRVAAIGDATANAWPGDVDLVPAVSTQEGLLGELPRPAGRVLFAGAEGARRLLVDEVGAEFVPVYRTKELRPDGFPDGDLVVLASPSAARAYAALAHPEPVVSIGPETTAAAERAGLRISAEARTHDLEGLVEAVGAATR